MIRSPRRYQRGAGGAFLLCLLCLAACVRTERDNPLGPEVAAGDLSDGIELIALLEGIDAEYFGNLLADAGLLGMLMTMYPEDAPIAVEVDLAEDASFRVDGLEAGVYTLLAVEMSTFERLSYDFAVVTVSDGQEVHATLGPDWLTEELQERIRFEL